MASFQYEVAEPLVEVNNVHLTLGKKEILSGVNFDIRNLVRPGLTQGQVIGLLGPSGVGKTQLFKIMAGLQRATSGYVLATTPDSNGKLIPVDRGLVGVVSQNYLLFEHRTVLSNLLVAARKGGYSKKEQMDEAMALLERFGLKDKAHLYPCQLSGGQRQRVAIAQQLLCSTSVLLMDEPFSGLDPVMVQEVCGLTSEVSSLDEHMTIIVTTHDVSSALSVADHLILLGRDRDPATGLYTSGAKVKEIYDLIERDLAWHPDIQAQPHFHDLVREIKMRFRTL